MAVEKSGLTRSASARFDAGLDQNGRNKTITRTIASFKTDAALEDVYSVVQEVASLCQNNLLSVNMTEKAELMEV